MGNRTKYTARVRFLYTPLLLFPCPSGVVLARKRKKAAKAFCWEGRPRWRASQPKSAAQRCLEGSTRDSSILAPPWDAQ